MFFLTGCPRLLKPDTTPEDSAKPDLRLSADVIPTLYTLDLNLDPAQEAYSGHLRIDVRLKTTTQRIRLHAKALSVSNVKFRGIAIVEDLFVETIANGEIELSSARALPAGDGALEMTFSGKITETPDGLYRVKDGGEYYIFSQFEPISARTAFPCFDEPRFKAPFQVTVSAPEGQLVVSNAPEVSRESKNGKSRFVFRKTKPLPTYLVAFGVGPLEVVSAPELIEDRIPFRIVVPKGKTSLTNFAIRETPAIHESLRRYLAADYPYQKLDFMAVPNFRAGAMENAGLVTFREALLLVDESKVTGGRLRAIRSVIAHELAHMWFGNSLTLKWWDDIWLNEAFATWMADRVNLELGDAETSRRSIARSKQRVMRLDAKASVRAIRQPIETEGDIENAFDGISYRKGASVLWMLESWLGEEELRKALRAYVGAHEHQSVATDDLMTILDRETKKPVRQMSKVFLNEPGAPQLKFELECAPQGSPKLRVQQSVLRDAGGPKLPWRVPVCVRYGTAKKTYTTCFELQDSKASVDLSGENCPTWFYGNAHESGYYSWSMSSEWFGRLLKHLSVLTAVEQSALPARLRRRAESGRMTLMSYIQTLTMLLGNDLKSVKSEALNNLSALGPVLGTTATKREQFNVWLGGHLRPIWVDLQKHEVNPEDIEGVRFRDRVRRLLAFEARDRAVLSAGLQTLRGVITKPGDTWTSEDRQMVTVGGLALTEEDWQALRKRLNTERDAANRSAIIRAMSSAPQAGLRVEARALFTKGIIEAQNFWLVARGLGWRDRDERWQWIQNSLPDLKARLTEGGFSGLPWIGAGYCSESKSKELDQVFMEHLAKHPAMSRSLALSKDYIAECISLRKQWHHELDDVLQNMSEKR